MGKGGRPRKPTALKKLQGTYRKDRAMANEPAPPAGEAVRPKGLDRIARDRWDVLAPALTKMGVLSPVDAGVLEGLVRHYSRAVQADKVIGERGLLLDTPFGPKANPAVKISKESWTLYHQLGAKLGLSPADRARLSVPEKITEDDVEKDLFGVGLRVVKGGAGV